MHEKLKHIAARRRNERVLFDWYEYISRMMEHARGYSFYRFETPRVRGNEDERRARIVRRKGTNDQTQERQHGDEIL